jgi:hypothetical protein
MIAKNAPRQFCVASRVAVRLARAIAGAAGEPEMGQQIVDFPLWLVGVDRCLSAAHEN